MRISRAAFCLFAVGLSGCGITAARGVDGPPGASGSAPSLIVPDVNGARTPPRFQNVMVIAPEPGARCSGSFSSEAAWVERNRVANARREVVLHIELSSKNPTITCKKNGETWKRRMPRLVVKEWAERVIRTADGTTHRMRGNKMYGFAPVFHVPAPDAEAPARWEAWRAATCVAPAGGLLGYLCGDALGVVMAADLEGGS